MDNERASGWRGVPLHRGIFALFLTQWISSGPVTWSVSSPEKGLKAWAEHRPRSEGRGSQHSLYF